MRKDKNEFYVFEGLKKFSKKCLWLKKNAVFFFSFFGGGGRRKQWKIYLSVGFTRFSLVWFGWVLWHINQCRLSNAKSSLFLSLSLSIYIYIYRERERERERGFYLVWFYGWSTFVRGAFNKFPDYFYRHLKLKIQYVIAIHLMNSYSSNWNTPY